MVPVLVKYNGLRSSVIIESSCSHAWHAYSEKQYSIIFNTVYTENLVPISRKTHRISITKLSLSKRKSVLFHSENETREGTVCVIQAELSEGKASGTHSYHWRVIILTFIVLPSLLRMHSTCRYGLAGWLTGPPQPSVVCCTFCFDRDSFRWCTQLAVIMCQMLLSDGGAEYQDAEDTHLCVMLNVLFNGGL